MGIATATNEGLNLSIARTTQVGAVAKQLGKAHWRRMCICERRWGRVVHQGGESMPGWANPRTPWALGGGSKSAGKTTDRPNGQTAIHIDDDERRER